MTLPDEPAPICPSCKEPYAKPHLASMRTLICSNPFHRCRDCRWEAGGCAQCEDCQVNLPVRLAHIEAGARINGVPHAYPANPLVQSIMDHMEAARLAHIEAGARINGIPHANPLVQSTVDQLNAVDELCRAIDPTSSFVDEGRVVQKTCRLHRGHGGPCYFAYGRCWVRDLQTLKQCTREAHSGNGHVFPND